MRASMKAALAAAAALSLLLVGCSGASGGSSDKKIVLNMWGFSDLYKPQVKQYEKEHPNITIQTKISDYDASHQTLLTALAANKGPDFAQIAIDYMGEFVAKPGAFQDLRQYGADKIEKNYLDWRWAGGVATNGHVVGIPTDVGGMAIAYRTDLFQAAGLPTDPKAVSALWPDWDGYLATGQKYVAATGKKFVDSGKSVFRAESNQGDEKYYNRKGKTVYESNPQIKKSFDDGVAAIDGGMSANVATFTPQWNAALTNGGFATIPAPAWLLGTIEQQAPDLAKKWNIATLPGVSGNDGGSFLVIPKASAHPKEAYDFISWLENPKQELANFKDTNTFPSTPSLYSDPAVTSLKNPYFNGAPVGRIYIASLKAVKGHPTGPQDRIIENQFENALGRVDQGQQKGPDAWKQALGDAKREITG